MEFIAVELVLVFGSVLAFAWWQLRDLDREKAKREKAKREKDKIEKSRRDEQKAREQQEPGRAP